jgi:hypothetical protein
MRQVLKLVSSSVQALSLSLLTVAAIAVPSSNSQAQSTNSAGGTTVTCPCTNGNDCGPPTYNANTGYSCPNPQNCGAAANCSINVVITNPITE